MLWDNVKSYLPTALRRANTVLSIISLFSVSPLASLFGLDLAFYENIAGLVLFLILGAIWYAIEVKYARSVPNSESGWQQFSRCLNQDKFNKLKQTFNKKNPQGDLSFGQYLTICLDSVLYFSVLLAFFRFVLFVCGYDKLISPITLSIGFCVIFGLCFLLARLNYQNSKKIISDFNSHVTEAKGIEYTPYYQTKGKNLFGYKPDQKFIFMREDEDFDQVTYGLKIVGKVRGVYLFFWHILSIAISLAFYFFVQWMMPFHELLGRPYVLGVIASGVLCLLLFKLRTNYLGDIVRECRPVIAFFVGVATFDFLIDSIVLMVTGVPIQQQVIMPWLHTSKYVCMFFFAVFLLLSEHESCRIPESDIILNVGRIIELKDPVKIAQCIPVDGSSKPKPGP